MKITQLNIYPIKSLRGISLDTAFLCAQGLAYDRRYILLRPSADEQYDNMFVGERPEMALFHCSLTSPTAFAVSYHIPSQPVTSPRRTQKATVEIPLEPDTTNLAKVNITMHTTPSYPAYLMPESINAWFSDCFGYEVVLAYMGDVLGIPRRDEKTAAWTPRIRTIIPGQEDVVNFSDGAALLVVSEDSLAALHARLEGEKAVLEKFRPNIVVDGPGVAWDEDFWGELVLTRLGVRVPLTSNCARCISINVDLENGRMAEGASGKLLKKMMGIGESTRAISGLLFLGVMGFLPHLESSRLAMR